MNPAPTAVKTATIIRPEQLVAIRNLSLRARLIVEGMMAGLHKSPFHGFSVEFLEYRPYRNGESARSIDWRKFARSDKAVVRLFEDETNLRANLLLDKSASMRFASKRSGVSKLDYAKTLVASLAWILIRQRDAVGLAAFDESISVRLPPRSTNVQLKSILTALDAIEPGAQTRCGGAVDAIAAHLVKRGLCVLFSDLFDDPHEIIRGLHHLRFKRQDVMVLWILDPLEIASFEGVPYRLRDLETGAQLSIDGGIASRLLRDGMNRHRSTLEHACKELSVDLEIISTDEPFQKALLRILEKRRRLF
jgi:uncharacterized protein (DUF58 family)